DLRTEPAPGSLLRLSSSSRITPQLYFTIWQSPMHTFFCVHGTLSTVWNSRHSREFSASQKGRIATQGDPSKQGYGIAAQRLRGIVTRSPVLGYEPGENAQLDKL
ncbi:MAG: hypothetical protein IJ112_03755, partial [Oscillospiraceae bacterium]|nr:hypothetical protein [Oscillospiraceae bacterium]